MLIISLYYINYSIKRGEAQPLRPKIRSCGLYRLGDKSNKKPSRARRGKKPRCTTSYSEISKCIPAQMGNICLKNAIRTISYVGSMLSPHLALDGFFFSLSLYSLFQLLRQKPRCRLRQFLFQVTHHQRFFLRANHNGTDHVAAGNNGGDAKTCKFVFQIRFQQR